jgi:hypothetical protein
MLPISLSFRRLLKFGLGITSREIDRYDALMAFRQQLLEENRAIPNKAGIKLANDITKEIHTDYNRYGKRFKRLQSLYMARRYYAMKQGRLLQIPDSGKEWFGFFRALRGNIFNSISHRIIRLYFRAK